MQSINQSMMSQSINHACWAGGHPYGNSKALLLSSTYVRCRHAAHLRCLTHTFFLDHEQMVSVITAWGVQWTGLPHSPKTDGDRLNKDL